MQTNDTTTSALRSDRVAIRTHDYDASVSTTHIIPLVYPETAKALQVMVNHIEAQICDLWHYGSQRDHRIGAVTEKVAGIIAQTRLLTILTGDYPHDERVVYTLRKTCFAAEKRALARLRK